MANANTGETGPTRSMRWGAWALRETSTVSGYLFLAVMALTVLGLWVAFQQNCEGLRASGDECMLTRATALALPALWIIVFSPWLAAIAARRANLRRARAYTTAFGPREVQVTGWFTEGGLDEERFRAYRGELRRAMEGNAPGSLGLSAAAFLAALGALLLVASPALGYGVLMAIWEWENLAPMLALPTAIVVILALLLGIAFIVAAPALRAASVRQHAQALATLDQAYEDLLVILRRGRATRPVK